MADDPCATAAGRTLPDEKPCKCHQSHAYVAPFHPGHCCFWPPTRTCHPEAVADWERQSNLRRDMRVNGTVLDAD